MSSSVSSGNPNIAPATIMMPYVWHNAIARREASTMSPLPAIFRLRFETFSIPRNSTLNPACASLRTISSLREIVMVSAWTVKLRLR